MRGVQDERGTRNDAARLYNDGLSVGTVVGGAAWTWSEKMNLTNLSHYIASSLLYPPDARGLRLLVWWRSKLVVLWLSDGGSLRQASQIRRS